MSFPSSSTGSPDLTPDNTLGRLRAALDRSAAFVCLDFAVRHELLISAGAVVFVIGEQGKLRPIRRPLLVDFTAARSEKAQVSARRSFLDSATRIIPARKCTTPVIWAQAYRPDSPEAAFASHLCPGIEPLDLQALVRTAVAAAPDSELASAVRRADGLADRRLIEAHSNGTPGGDLRALMGLLSSALTILWPLARPKVSPLELAASSKPLDEKATENKLASMSNYRDFLLATATDAIAGRIDDINVRRDGSLVLLNAGKEMLWTGFSPEAEVLKGLIVQVDEKDQAIELVAACLPKFYNHTESATNDAAFFAATEQPGARLVFTEKVDGSNLRSYWHPDHNRVEFATRGMLQVSSGANGFFDFCAAAAVIARAQFPALLDPALVRRYTIVTELIHPANQIVTHYGDREDLPVVAVIDLSTGAELPHAALVDFCREHKLHPINALAPTSPDFDQAIAAFRAAWADTDQEGTVVSVEIPDVPVPFRIKVKSLRYLALARLKNSCTLRRTREMVEANNLSSWEALRGYLMREFPELPEEIQMGYRDQFARWAAWDASVRTAVVATLAIYADLPERLSDQKTFALSIASRPDKSALFLLRNAKSEEAGHVALENLIRRNFEDRLVETVEAIDPSLAG